MAAGCQVICTATPSHHSCNLRHAHLELFKRGHGLGRMDAKGQPAGCRKPMAVMHGRAQMHRPIIRTCIRRQARARHGRTVAVMRPCKPCTLVRRVSGACPQGMAHLWQLCVSASPTLAAQGTRGLPAGRGRPVAGVHRGEPERAAQRGQCAGGAQPPAVRGASR